MEVEIAFAINLKPSKRSPTGLTHYHKQTADRVDYFFVPDGTCVMINKGDYTIKLLNTLADLLKEASVIK